MKKTALFIITIMTLAAILPSGILALNVENSKEDKIKVNTTLENYQVNNRDKVENMGEFSQKLAEKNNLGIEIIEERTQYARHFLNTDGTYTAYLTLKPTCYKDENNVWRDFTTSDSKSQSMTILDDNTKEYSTYWGHVLYKDDQSINIIDPDDSYFAITVLTPSTVSNDQCIYIGQDTYNDELCPWVDCYHEFWRGFAQFDLSSIPLVEDVTSVSLTFYPSSKTYDPFHKNEHEQDPGHKYADLRVFALNEDSGKDNSKPSDFYDEYGGHKKAWIKDGGTNAWKDIREFFADCEDGNRYYPTNTNSERVDVGDSALYKTWQLSDEAETLIEVRANDPDGAREYFVVCFDDKNEDYNSWVLGGNSGDYSGGVLLTADSANDLILEVEYELVNGDVALIVEGGPGGSDSCQADFRNACNLAIETCEDLGYYPHNVISLTKPTKVELKNGIKAASKMIGMQDGKFGNLLFYIVDHGVGSAVWNDLIDKYGGTEGNIVLNPSMQYLSTGELASYFDACITDNNNHIPWKVLTIVIEACFSGEFVMDVTNPSIHGDYNDKRIIITTTDWDHVSWGAVDERYPIFSKKFFETLADGKSYGKAYEAADAKVCEIMKNLRGENYPKSETTSQIGFLSALDKFLPKNFNVLFRQMLLSLKQKVSVAQNGRIYYRNIGSYDSIYDDYEQLRMYLKQRPILTDNGVGGYDCIGKGKLAGEKVANKCNDEEGKDGWLALHTYPGPNN